MEDASIEHEKYKKELTSDFNEAKFQIYRLHILWLSCNNLSQAGKLKEWKWKLDTIWRELSADAIQKDKNKDNEGTYTSKLKSLNESIAKSTEDTILYNVLQEKEIFLRCLQEEVGKGSKKSSTEQEDFEE